MLKLLKRFTRKQEPRPESATETVGLAELGNAETVGDVFPVVRHLAVNMSIRAPDNEIEPSLTNRSFGPQSRAFFHFRCKNVECRDGGFDLRQELEEAVAERQGEISGRRICRGRCTASNMVGEHQCFFELNFRIHISYR